MICDRCRARIERSDNPDQPLCSSCLRHLRAGGGWALGSPTPKAAHEPLRVDLDLLPIRAQVLYSAVPLYPIDSDFHTAASTVFHEEDEPAAHWRIEAVRWRIHHRGAPLDAAALATIAGWTAARLLRLAEKRNEGASASAQS
jgi:hypothetical protein